MADTPANPPAAHPAASSPDGKSKDLRDSKGWDGKLRIGKKASLSGISSDSDTVGSDDANENAPPPELIDPDEDLLNDVEPTEEDIELIHCKITSIPALRLERFTAVVKLCLRQNRISAVELPDDVAARVEDIDLYDNLITHIRGLDACTKLKCLDLSFNKIKHIKRVNHLAELRDLFFVQNMIGTIEGLDGLTKLRQLELGANRIREIRNLESLTSLEELWLGKNKITELKGLDTLSNLKILSVQSNRLRRIAGLEKLTALTELHISHNNIDEIDGLACNTKLEVLDISMNPITHLRGLGALARLQELWASSCRLADFAELETELAHKQELKTVYFEGNPLQTDQPVHYRSKVKLALPNIVQIDATFAQTS